MLKSRYEWEIMCPDAGAVDAVAGAHHLSAPVARALVNPAVDRINRALDAHERILILGDYDVDGISGTALLVSYLRELGADVNYYIPDRVQEGYGLNHEMLRKSHKAGYSLIVTVDSGVSAVSEAALAAELGLDMIVTDHHEPPAELPAALALINPKREDCTYPFRELAGVGVAFKLAAALAADRGESQESMAERFDEIVALGSVADMVSLLDENRVLVSHGLARMSRTRNLGLYYLIDVARYSPEDKPDTHLVSFGLAPRINAAGRVWNPRAGVELLLAESAERAQQLAGKLDSHNRARMKEEGFIIEQAAELLAGSDILDNDRAIVLFHEEWNIGIVGIVASRLIEQYYRPVVLITLSGRPDDRDNPHPAKGRVCQGSVRSIREVDIHATLCQCEDLLLSYGGHPMAAGLKIYENDIPELRARLNELLATAAPAEPHASLKIDDFIDPGIVNLEMIRQTGLMEPCGVGNPRPVFAARALTVLEARAVGADGAHLQLKLGRGSAMLDAIAFRFAAHWPDAHLNGACIDAAFSLKEDNFRNRRTVKLNILDVRTAED